ncbi:hypothetical protein [Lysinibacillus sp. LZ02]|uniref:hypothetical protein n=1 Tax=Lysinibacillus sp. LZ02 TaxID=3420668 RepID=UPI003D35A50B
MQITVQKKSLGRSRKLEAVVYELAGQPQTLRELLRALVEVEVARYNEADSLLRFLIEAEEATIEERGKAKFSTLSPRAEQSLEKSVQVMELAFLDGLFKVLQGQYVYTSLDEAIHSDEPAWTFIKLTFLAGR